MHWLIHARLLPKRGAIDVEAVRLESGLDVEGIDNIPLREMVVVPDNSVKPEELTVVVGARSVRTPARDTEHILKILFIFLLSNNAVDLRNGIFSGKGAVKSIYLFSTSFRRSLPLIGKVTRSKAVIVPVIDNMKTKKISEFTNVKMVWKRFHAIHLIRCIACPIKYRLIIFASIRLHYDHTPFCKVPLCYKWRWSKAGDSLRMAGSGISSPKFNKQLESIGLDTWGVDFALLDSQGALLSKPFHFLVCSTTG